MIGFAEVRPTPVDRVRVHGKVTPSRYGTTALWGNPCKNGAARLGPPTSAAVVVVGNLVMCLGTAVDLLRSLGAN